MAKKRNKLSPDELDFQPDALEIKKRPISKGIRWVLYLIILFIILLVVWASISKVDRVIVARGKVITDSPIVSIQPLKTSIIKKIHVERGDSVKEGQVLVTLDPTFARADLSQLSKRLVNIKVQLRRINAELKGKSFSPTSAEGDDGSLQLSIFKQRKQTFIQRKNLFAEKLSALQSKLEKNLVERQGLGTQAKLLRDIEGITAREPQTGDEGKLKLLTIQKDRYRTTNSLARLKVEEQVLNNEIKQIKTERSLFVEDRRRKLMESKVSLHTERNKLIENINKAKKLEELVLLKAPKGGTILEIGKHLAEGSVVSEAKVLMTIIPINARHEVQIEIKAMDIGKVDLGADARIKFDAFPFQKYGALDGSIRSISGDAFQKSSPSNDSLEKSDMQSRAYYRAWVNLGSGALEKVDNFKLVPGMKVTVEIKVNRKRVIDYFLYPILRGLDNAAREPE